MSHLIRNRYSLTQIIGKGTYGRVYECIDVQEAGIKKVIKESVFGNDDGFDPYEYVFNLEVAVYEALAKSPNSKFFPKLFESFVLEDPRKGYLVLEKLGYPVRMIRKQNLDNCFSFTNTAKIAMSVARGLKYLHECGYLHRDLQESNVVFSRDTNSEVVCKIIDFGAAQEIHNEDGTINFEYPDMDFTNCSFSSLALNFMLPADEQDDFESFFYFVLAIFNRFNLYGGPEKLIEEKTKLHLDPISVLDDGFLVQLWLSIVGQGYRKKFNPDEVLEVFTDLDVDYEQPLDCEQVGYYFIVE
ncbi:hypothetical protein CAEBREN_06723 [Caenorhabditis brenneri]|uniref:Protein kinase domain-containing protein n=1 Tax=Caenorhabditis brenneri TaxID=135651 RepID=G0NGM6_CAEBE|nr:hypothetical protein CAEBREN_06723 [Caenorhabditis brenneri]